MKSIIRTIMVLAVLGFVMGSPALAQGVSAGASEGVGNQPSQPTVATPSESTEPAPPPSSIDVVSSAADEFKLLQEVAGGLYDTLDSRCNIVSTFVGGKSSNVLVIPNTDIKAEDVAAIGQDMQIMSRIFDRKFSKGSYLVREVFPDYGDFFRRDSRATEAIYLQGYGALFLMQANFPLTAPPKSKEKEAQKTEEPADPIWQRAKQEIFDPMIRTTRRISQPGEKYDAEQIEEVKKELVKSLKHAANIRNLKPDEWVILTVIGKGRSYGVGGYGYGVGGYGGGGYGGSMSMSDYEAKVSVPPNVGRSYSRTGSGLYRNTRIVPGGVIVASSTVLTIRAKKSDVDTFAKGDLDYDKFREKVQVLTYSSLGQTVGRRLRITGQRAGLPPPSESPY